MPVPYLTMTICGDLSSTWPRSLSFLQGHDPSDTEYTHELSKETVVKPLISTPTWTSLYPKRASKSYPKASE